MNPDQERELGSLRVAAETRVNLSVAAIQPSDVDLARIRHELEVHQIELVMQNEQLIASRAEVEAGLERYTDLFDFAPIGYINFSVDGVVLLANLAASRLVGIERKPLVGRRFTLFVAESSRAAFKRFLEAVFATDVKQVELLTLVGKQNTPLIIRMEGIRSRSGVECQAALLDVSELTRSQHKLAEKDQLFAMAIELALGGHVIWDIQTNKVEYSRHWKSLLGYQEDEIGDAFCEWQSRSHPDDLARTMAKVNAFLESTEDVIELEGRMRHKDGTYRHFLSRAVQIREGGRPVRVLATSLDQTERKQREETRLLMNQAVQAVTQGVIIADATDQNLPIVFVNPGFELMTGYAAADCIGRNCRFLQGPDTDPAAVELIRSAIREQRPCAVELLNYRQDGTPFWNALSITPIQDEAGRLVYYVGIQTDVTTRRNAEEQLRQSQKVQAVGQLAGGIAHDFNNLLTVIDGYTNMLLSTPTGVETNREYLLEIHQAATRAADLTRQLLAFSRQQIVTPQHLNLNEVIVDTMKLLERLIGEEIEIKLMLESELPCIWADRGQVTQILINLALNGRDAMPNGGVLTILTKLAAMLASESMIVPDVALKRDAQVVQMIVTDDGIGMSPETKARIFEPFFTTKPPGKGTGLGMATVFSAVTQSNGRIDFTSELGQGTCFTVQLPRSKELMPLDVQSPQKTGSIKGSELILLVEDDDSVRRIIRTILTDYGYEVLEANGGQQAIELAAEHGLSIKLLVSDVIFPRKTVPRS